MGYLIIHVSLRGKKKNELIMEFKVKRIESDNNYGYWGPTPKF